MADQLSEQRKRQRALIMLLAAAVENLYGHGRELIVDHSFDDGYFCHFTDFKPLSGAELAAIHEKMKNLQKKFKRLKRKPTTNQDWRHLNGPTLSNHRPPTLCLGEFCSPSYETTELDLNLLPRYELLSYNGGFLIRDGRGPGGTLRPFKDYPKLFNTMEEYETWGRILNVHSVKELNKQVKSRDFKELIWVAEGLHEKKIAQIADAITQRTAVKFVFIAVPSSSGKTTFTKRLAIQLKVNGINARTISMDNYFIDRKDMVPLPDGTLDLESLDCVNLAALQKDMQALLKGESVAFRDYDFKFGRPHFLEKRFSLGKHDILIIEGIHGLNPKITESLKPRNYFKIYISALTQLNIDNHYPVSTSDARLLRRLVRDAKFRGYTAQDTLTRWNSVRYGEVHNIFPYQEQCDMMFNSALIYELSVLKHQALPLLKQAPPSPIRNRMLVLLKILHTIPARFVPGTSILREFIGKSYFHY